MGPSTIPHGEVMTRHRVLQVLSRDGDGSEVFLSLVTHETFKVRNPQGQQSSISRHEFRCEW